MLSERTPQITVVDSMMGTGKSTWMIDLLNEWANPFKETHDANAPERWLVVVPSLSEVDRFRDACPLLQLRDPVPRVGSKLEDLRILLTQGDNIVTTHALFSMLTPDINRLIRDQGYGLVIDEVLTTVDVFSSLTKKDKDFLFSTGIVYIEVETKRLRWNEKKHGDYTGRFEDVRKLCQIGSLVLYRGSVLIWEFPSEFLRAFEQVWILTYMFEGSPMASYLRAEGFDYETRAVSGGQLVDTDSVDESAQKAKLRELITVYEGPLNAAGVPKGKEHPLSSSWFKRANDPVFASLKRNTETFFKCHAGGTPAAQNMWTTFKTRVSKLKGTRYARQWVPNNAKATNDFIEKRSLAYLCNVFMLPHIKAYFEDRDIAVYEDLYALSEMIQWVWRSQIRREDPITLFIPSQRMRDLLQQWLESTNTVELVKGQTRDLKQAA